MNAFQCSGKVSGNLVTETRDGSGGLGWDERNMIGQVMQYYNRRDNVNAIAYLTKPITAMNSCLMKFGVQPFGLGKLNLFFLHEINWYE